MYPPTAGKLYKTKRDYSLRDKELNVLDMDDVSNWILNDAVFLLVDAEERPIIGRDAIGPAGRNWVLHIIYGEKIGWIFTFDERWQDEFSLLAEPGRV